METHAKVLGVLNIVLGVIGLAGALVVMVVFGGVAGLLRAEGDPDAAFVTSILGVTGLMIVLFTLVTSLPSIIIGYGLFRLRPWSRLAGIVLSIVSLIMVPFGTALGIYGLWVLYSKEGQGLFETGTTVRA